MFQFAKVAESQERVAQLEQELAKEMEIQKKYEDVSVAAIACIKNVTETREKIAQLDETEAIAQFDKAIAECIEITREVGDTPATRYLELQKENEGLHSAVDLLTKEIEELKGMNQRWENSYDELKKDCDHLDQEVKRLQTMLKSESTSPNSSIEENAIVVNTVEEVKPSGVILAIGDLVEVTTDRIPNQKGKHGTLSFFTDNKDYPIAVRLPGATHCFHRTELKLTSTASEKYDETEPRQQKEPVFERGDTVLQDSEQIELVVVEQNNRYVKLRESSGVIRSGVLANRCKLVREVVSSIPIAEPINEPTPIEQAIAASTKNAEAKIAAEDLLSFGKSRKQMEALTWQKVQIACKGNADVLRELSLVAQASAQEARRKTLKLEFWERLPLLYANYVEQTGDRADLSWIPTKLWDLAAEIIENRDSSKPELSDRPSCPIAIKEDETVSTNQGVTESAIAKLVQPKAEEIEEVIDVANEMVQEEKANTPVPFEQKSVTEFLQGINYRGQVEQMCWEELKMVCPNMESLYQVRKEASNKIHEELVARIPQILAEYIWRTEDRSDLEWVSKKLRDNAIALLAGMNGAFKPGEFVEVTDPMAPEAGRILEIKSVEDDWIKAIDIETRKLQSFHCLEVTKVKMPSVAA